MDARLKPYLNLVLIHVFMAVLGVGQTSLYDVIFMVFLFWYIYKLQVCAVPLSRWEKEKLIRRNAFQSSLWFVVIFGVLLWILYLLRNDLGSIVMLGFMFFSIFMADGVLTGFTAIQSFLKK